MKLSIRRFTKRIFVIITVLVSLCMVLVALIPHLNPDTFWWIGILGIGFIFLLFAQIFFLIFWLLLKSRWTWLPLIVLILSIQQIKAVVAWSPLTTWAQEKPAEHLRVLDWNVSRWDEYNKVQKGGQSFRQDMLNVIQKQNADVLCLQEFFESKMPKKHEPTIIEIVSMGYPYYYFSPEGSKYGGKYLTGVAIFSKFPILDSARVSFSRNSRAESIISCDINKNGKIFRIATTHLQSVLFDANDYQNIEAIKTKNTEAIPEASRTILRKLKKGYAYRSEQARQVREHVENSPYPVIITGDFNDIPNSYSYFTIRKNLKDAFIEKGFGLGKTFRFISPTLRIDFILIDPGMKVRQYKKIKVPYSDHYPILADLEL